MKTYTIYRTIHAETAESQSLFDRGYREHGRYESPKGFLEVDPYKAIKAYDNLSNEELDAIFG